MYALCIVLPCRVEKTRTNFNGGNNEIVLLLHYGSAAIACGRTTFPIISHSNRKSRRLPPLVGSVFFFLFLFFFIYLFWTLNRFYFVSRELINLIFESTAVLKRRFEAAVAIVPSAAAPIRAGPARQTGRHLFCPFRSEPWRTRNVLKRSVTMPTRWRERHFSTGDRDERDWYKKKKCIGTTIPGLGLGFRTRLYIIGYSLGAPRLKGTPTKRFYFFQK